MHDKLMKLIQSKKAHKGEMKPLEKHAKEKVLGDLHSMAEDDMGGRVKGLKKVAVESNSAEGLAHGLAKAKELADEAASEGESPEHESSEASKGEDSDESHGAEAYDELTDNDASEHMNEDELNAKIEELMKMKEKLQGNKSRD